MARSELESRHADRVPQLHQRAAQWYQANGHVDEAITHLRAAGLRHETAELIQANWLTFVDAGRAPTVLSWLQSLGRNPDGFDPAEAVTAAWMAAMFGDEAGLARHLQSLEGYADYGPLPDGSALGRVGAGSHRGAVRLRRTSGDARATHRAVELETDGLSPFYCMAHLGLGHAAYVTGELNLATDLLSTGDLVRGRAGHRAGARTVGPVPGRG